MTPDPRELERINSAVARQRAKADPVAFARLLTVLDEGREVAFVPDPWQCDVLRYTGDRLILNVARQSGKSTVLAILALWRAIFTAGSLIVIVSGSQRQSDEVLRKVMDFLSRLPVKPKLSEDNKRSVEFENRSRIVALPSKDGTIRGFSAPSILIEDEAGEVPDTVNAAIAPMLLRSSGKFIMSGTPKGKRGHFYETWHHGGDEWKRVRLTAAEAADGHPKRIAWLAREKADLSRRGMEEIYRQEYECAFIDAASGRVYSGFDEDRNVIGARPATDDLAPWTYLLGLDFGIVDQNALSVLAWRAYDPCVYIVESYKLRGDALTVGEEVKRLDGTYRFSKIVGDVGGMGKGFEAIMRSRQHIPIAPAEKHNKAGYISLFNGELRTGNVKVVRGACSQLIDEWLTLAWAEGGQKEGAGENHCADSAIYGWRSSTAHNPEERKRRPETPQERIADFKKAEEKRWQEIERQGDESVARTQRGNWLDAMEADTFGEDGRW